MYLRLMSLITMVAFCFCLIGCALKDQHQVASGAYYFDQGYYKRAMADLLPAAVDGNSDAQYAVGYMYYYGYGVSQDTDVGYFWIQKAARCHNPKAIEAIQLIAAERDAPIKRTYKRYLTENRSY